MKQSFYFILFLISLPFALDAQTMVMTPDSGYQGQYLSVTIVGNGTKFATSKNVSTIDVMLERSGQDLDDFRQAYLFNDSTIKGDLYVSPNMTPGLYDLVVSDIDTSFKQSAAFYVTMAPASISSISPSSAYDSQTVSLQITGENTTFQIGPSPTIFFEQNGNTYFSTQNDSVSSNTSIEASVNVPNSAPSGYYEVIVQNNVYSDTGREFFRVLGPKPTVALVPDSGAASSTFDVSIVGQGTSFSPTTGTSTPYLLNIDLKQNGVTYYHVVADTVFSTTLADAVFSLDSTITPGIYDAEIYGNSSNGTPYDLYTTFLVTAHHTTIRSHQGYSIAAKPDDTVTIGVTGSGVNFIYQGNFAKTVRLVNGAYSITGTNVKVTNDTSLSAFFAIPADATIGSYDVQIVEPGKGTVDTGHTEFVVIGSYVVTNCTLSPDSGEQGQNAGGCLSGAGLPGNIQSMYLRQGASIIPVVQQLSLPDCFPVSFSIPSTAGTGLYDLVFVLSGDGLGDTVIVKNAFSIEGAASVGDSPSLSESVQNLSVSPNPAQDIASISFTMGEPSHIRLIIYDALGRTIATLCDRTIGAGSQNFEWTATNMPAGGYFYKLTAGENIYGGRVVIQH